MNASIYLLLWSFLIWSFLGWCAGVAVASLRRRTFVNTGFLDLPLCPVYGTAAVLFSIFLSDLKDHLFFLFLGGAVIAACLTFFTGFLLERIFRRKWWDFTRRRFQFEGYISVPLLALWGLLAVLSVRVGDPLLARLSALIPRHLGWIILAVCYGLTGLDLALSLGSMLQLRHGLRRLSGLEKDFQELSARIGNAITRRVQRRLLRAYPELDRRSIARAQREVEDDGGVFAKGCCFHKLVWLFAIAAFLGDVIETLFCKATMGEWMSRSSVVWGPFSVVWGLGAVMLTAALYKYKDKSDGVIFLAGTVLGGAYEYMCSVFTELVFGAVFWDYSHLPFNLGGRINLLYCFFWGIAAVVWLKLLYPPLSRLIERIPRRAGQAGTWVLLAFLVLDMAVSSLALVRYVQRQTQPDAPQNAVTAVLDRRFPDSRMARVYPKAQLADGRPAAPDT